MAIDGIGINAENWRNKPVKEVVSNMNIVEEEDAEVAQWAQAMSAVANAPDNVTYDMTGGSVEEFTAQLEAITANGLPNEEESEEAAKAADEGIDAVDNPEEVPPEEEEPDVGDVDEVEDEEEVPVAPEEETPPETTPPEGEEEEDVTLADEAITTDNETIRKRKSKKGDTPEQ